MLLQDPSLWSSALFEGGNGSLGDSFTPDSIVLTGSADSVVFLDDIFCNPPAAGPILGDINRDGFVGVDDLNAILSNWNQGTPPPADALAQIPEPATATFAVLAFSSAVLRRQTR